MADSVLPPYARTLAIVPPPSGSVTFASATGSVLRLAFELFSAIATAAAAPTRMTTTPSARYGPRLREALAVPDARRDVPYGLAGPRSGRRYETLARAS
jgi:hypothetical protein